MQLQGAPQSKSAYEPHFNDPRLRMTIGGRVAVRIVGAISYFFAAGSAVTFLISDIAWLRSAGAFIVLILLDRLWCLREADHPLSMLPAHGPVFLERYLAPAAFRIIERGYDRSVIKKTDVGLEIVHQLVDSKSAKEALRRLDISFDEFTNKLDDLLRESGRGDYDDESRRAVVSRIMGAAFSLALLNKNVFIQGSDIFAACATFGEGLLARLFVTFSIDPGDLERALLFSTARSRIPFFRGAAWGIADRRRKNHRIMNRAWTSRPTPTLDRYGVDFTDLARQDSIGMLIGHEAEYERIIETLGRPINPNALLVGEAGIGKETIVSHLAYALAKDKVPTALFDRRLVSLELNSLVAGATPDELHARIQRIVREIEIAGNIILYLPDIHNLLRTSGTAYLSAADALMPVIMNNAFPIVGATYPREYKTLIEPRSDFVGSFEVVRVAEISEADAAKILVYESVSLERQYKCIISFGAIKTAVQIAKKYFHSKYLPSSAEELLKAALVAAERRGVKAVTPQLVIEVAEEKVNIPLHEAQGEEAEKLLNLEELIHERLVDQEEAVKAVANALREYRSGLSRQGGPIASFLFVGPTGVGKTELAKILAKVQFGSTSLMVRFDMTEYQDKASFARFIGSPDGSIAGALTEAVLQKPYCLILLDEFEKAYPDILNMFLQVFDDARLTDGIGRVVDFENTIIIATSNAHSDIMNEALSKGESVDSIAEYLKRKLTDVFKPELLNRFSKIVVFKDLNIADMTKVAELTLKELSEGLRAQGITLTFDSDVVQQIAKMGYDPAFGARPLRRVIEEHLRAGLAEAILRKKIGRGGNIHVTLEGDRFVFAPDQTMP